MRAVRALVILSAVALLGGCQQLFTTSLAKGLARTTVTIPADISAADAQALLADSSTSQAACASLLKVLNDQAATSTTSAGLAVEAAVLASGLAAEVAPKVLDIASEFIASGTPPTDLTALIATLQDVTANADAMEAIARLGSGATLDAAVVAAADLSPTDTLLVALVLATTALPVGVTDPMAMTAGQITTFQSDPNVLLAGALLTQAGADLVAAGGDSSLIDAISSWMQVTP